MLTINYSLTSRVEDRSQRTTGSWRIEDRTHNLEGPHDSTVLRKSPYKAKDYQLLVENKTWTERLQRDKRDLEITTENLRLSYCQVHLSKSTFTLQYPQSKVQGDFCIRSRFSGYQIRNHRVQDRTEWS